MSQSDTIARYCVDEKMSEKITLEREINKRDYLHPLCATTITTAITT